MRITNNLIQQTSLNNVQRNLKQIHAAQERVSSGLKMQRASDDPVGAAESMRTRGSIRALEQYRRGVETAISRADSEEQALDQASGILIRARELATMFASDTADQSARQAGKVEVEGLLRQAVSLANTRTDGGYLFGGLTSDAPPYGIDDSGPTLEFTTTGPTGVRYVEISENQRVIANHNGTEVFEDTGLLEGLRDLAAALGANDPDGIRGVMDDLDGAFESVQSLIGDVGSRSSLLHVTSANLDALETNLLTLKSEIEEVDIEKAITELVGRQTTFQAALLATSQVMNLTLANYLR
ncbi:MAG: flagellar hook-associated protein FlgL [Gemmatimonadota bacterium]